MKYIALIYTDPELTPQLGGTMNAGYADFTRRAREAGVIAGGDALHGPATATTVRTRGGLAETMDGPFADTKEQLGGYYILDCADLDQAIHWAAQIPGAAVGAVELRPLVVFNG
ncbi:MAG: YciI family protein [Rhodobacteraceae bacterium]|nr:YciI family protein [Paracoccaceae bacterium]